MADKVVTTNMLSVPQGLITAELEGLYGTNVLTDMHDIIKLYQVYEDGAEFYLDTSGDYIPADLRYKIAKFLLDKEARFLFAKTPDFMVDVELTENRAENKRIKDASNAYKNLIDSVLKKNGFSAALLKAGKDCFIGKRVALMFNIHEEKGIQVSFLPSLEFVYDVDPNDANVLTKIIAFYSLNTSKNKNDQRIYKKKFWMENGFAHYSEAIYDGMGNLVEQSVEDETTKFTFIPAWVIVNDGLTGDLIGKSEIKELMDDESWYSRMAAADLDAERKGMNPIRYAIDASPESTANLSASAGSFWDIQTDQNQADNHTAQVGVLDAPMTYSDALGTTLNRIKGNMYEQVSVPNVSPEALKGVVSSGKTLKAIYWDLIVRCDEKMLVWRPALEAMAQCIIEGIKLYPGAAKFYTNEPLPDIPYSIKVDNQYPLPEDEESEKTLDLAEVNAQTMSKKSYMKKWRGLTDDEADDELRQIALERQLLEDSYAMPNTGQQTEQPPEEQEEEEGEEPTEE